MIKKIVQNKKSNVKTLDFLLLSKIYLAGETASTTARSTAP